MSDDKMKRMLEDLFSDVPSEADAKTPKKESEELQAYLALVDNMQDGAFIIQDAKFQFINRALARIIGFSTQEIVGQDFLALVAPEDQGLVADRYRRRLAGEDIPGEYQLRMVHKDGSYVRANITVTMGEYQGQVASIGTVKDVTSWQDAQEQLRQSQQMLQLIMDNIPFSVFWKDQDLVYLGANREFAQDAGLDSPEALVGKTDYDMPWTDQAELYQADDRQVMDAETPKLNYEEPQTTPDGDQIWLRTSKVPLQDVDGNTIAVLGMYEDITERKQMEQQIRESLARRTEEVQISTEVAQEISEAPALDELYRRVVTLVKERFGYYHAQIFRHDPEQDTMVVVEGYGEAGEAMKAAGHNLPYGQGVVGTAAASGEPVLASDTTEDPNWVPHPDLPETKGELAVPIMLRDEVLGVLDVQSDTAGALTEEDQVLLLGLAGQIASAIESTQALEQANTFRQFAETSGQGMGMAAMDGGIVYANPVLTRMLGADTPQALHGQNIASFYPPELVQQLQEEALPTVMAEGAWTGELPLVSPEGELTPAIQSIFLIHDNKGEPLYLANVITDITERKQTEAEIEAQVQERTEALQESEEQFRTIVEANPMGMHVYQLEDDGRLVFAAANPAADQLLGIDNSIFVGKSIEEAFPPLAETEVPERYRQAAVEGTPWRTEQITYDEGEIAGAFQVYAFQTSPGRMVAAFLDITDQRRAAGELLESQQKLAFHVQQTPLAIIEWNLDFEVVDWNPAAEQIFGYSQDEAQGRHAAGLIVPESIKEIVDQVWQDLLTQKGGTRSTNENITKDGKIITCEWYNTPLVDQDGNVLGVASLVQDITQQVLAQEELQKLASVVQYSSEIINLATPDGNMVFLNEAGSKILGIDPEEVEGVNIMQVIPENWLDTVQTELLPAITEKGTWEGDLQYRNLETGALTDVHAMAFTIRDPDTGAPLYLANVSLDITARKQLEQQIQESLARRTQEVQISTEVAQEIAGAPALDELYQRVVTLVKERFGYYHAQIFRHDPEQDVMVVVEGYGEAGTKMKAAGHSLPYGQGVVGTAAASGEPVLASDATEDPNWVPHPNLPDTEGELAVPIRLRDEVLGVLDVQSDQAGALTEEDQVMLLGLAGQIASAIESTRLAEQTQAALSETADQAQRLGTLHRMTEQLNQASSEEDIYRIAATYAPLIVEAERASVALLDSSGEQLEVLALQGEAGALPIGMQLPIEGTAVGLGVRENRLVVSHVTADSEFVDVRGLAKQGLGSAMNAPLAAGGQVIGSLNVGSKREQAYGERDENLLLQMASSLASAVANTRLLEQIRAALTETQRSQEALQEATELQTAILNNADYALISTTPEGVIQTFNPAAERMLGYSAGEIVNIKTPEIMHDLDEVVERAGIFSEELGYTIEPGFEVFVAKARQDLPNEHEWTYIHRDGSRIPVLLNVTALRDAEDNITGFLGIAQDIAGRKQAEAEREQLLAQTEALYAGSGQVVRTTTVDQVLQALVESTALQHLDRASIAFFDRPWQDEMPDEAIILAAWERSGQEPQAPAGTRYPLGQFPAIDAVTSGEPAIFRDVTTDERVGEALRAFLVGRLGMRSLGLWPLVAGGQWLGIVTGQASTPMEVGESEERQIASLIEQAAAVIQSQRLREQAQRRAVWSQTAAEVSRTASTVLDPDELIQQVVDLVRDRFDLYYAGLFLVEQNGDGSGEGKWAVLRVGTGEAGRQMVKQGHRLEIGGESMIGQCLATAQPRIAMDVGEEAVRFENPLLPDTRTELALPLISRGQALGALTIQSDQAAAFSEDDIAVLQTMADQLATTLDNANLIEQAQSRAEREQQVRMITDRIRRSADTETILRVAMEELGQMTGASKAVVRLGTRERLAAIGDGANEEPSDDLEMQTQEDSVGG